MSIHLISCRRGLYEKLSVARLVKKFSSLDENRKYVRVLLFTEWKKMSDATFIGKSHGTMGYALKFRYQSTRRGLKRKP
jgi:hypothetical protein